MNTLRIVSSTNEILHTESITTGRAIGARKVSRTAVKVASIPGARIEVRTRLGWMPRRLVCVRGTHYTRVA